MSLPVVREYRAETDGDREMGVYDTYEVVRGDGVMLTVGTYWFGG